MKKILFILSAAALAAVSCNKIQDRVEASFDPDEILFSAPSTRATVVETGSLTNVYITATTGTGSSEAAATGFLNSPFTLSGSVWSGGKFWPATDLHYHFYACNVNANPALTVNNGNVTVAPQNANTDIVVGYIASPTFRSTNTLALEHIFAQVGTVSMKAPAGYAVSNMKITLQPIVSGTYDVKQIAQASPEQKASGWTRGNAGSATYIFGNAQNGMTVSTESNNATVSSNDNDLWLVPGQYTLTASYTISKGDYTKNVTGSTCTVTLIQGRNNNIGPRVVGGQDQPNIPEPDDVSGIEFTVTVTPWQDNGVTAEF